MTKPNNFIMNSDYLSLAQTGSAEFTAYFPSETFQAGTPYTRTQDFTVQSQRGAVDMFLISLNGGDYNLGAKYEISRNSPFLNILIYRTNPSTIRVQLHEFTSQTGGYTMPMQTVKFKVSSFKPPNVF